MSRVAVLIALFLLFWQKGCVQCQDFASGTNTCASSFNTLASSVITPEQNQYNMQMAFFPPDTANPVYVTVRYIFVDAKGATVQEKVWFWSESTYYASFHPLRIYQYTSLFFGDFVFRRQSLTLKVQVDNQTMDCHNASDEFMMLLTQRLKLFAMSRSPKPGISDSYNPKAESAATVHQYHTKHRDMSRLLMSAQIIFPLIVLAWSILLLFYYLHHKKLASHVIGPTTGRREALVANAQENEAKKIDMKVKLSILFALSFMFSLYTCLLSIIAWTEGYKKLDKYTKEWYNKDTSELSTLFSLVIVMLTEDILIFFILLVGLVCGVISAVKPKYWWQQPKYWWLFCACSVVAPVLNVSVHANHIVFAFIHNQEHAVSVGIFYGIVIITNVHIMHVVSSLIKEKVSKRIWVIPLVNILLSVLINGLYAYIATIYVLLPINNAFDAAPNRIRLIYNSLIVSFVAYFTYWFIVKKKETQTGRPQGGGGNVQIN